MEFFETVANTVIRRPSIIVVTGAVMLAAAVFNAFIPVMAMLVGIVNMTGGSFLDSVLSLLQLLMDPGNLQTILIATAALTVLASLISGLILPGFLLTIDNGLKKGGKRKGLFTEGIKIYFFRFFLMTLGLSFISVLLAVFLMVAAVPAIIATKAALSTKPDLLAAAVFIDFVTAGAFFFCLSFFRIYSYMWYVAAAKGERKPFAAGKAVADRHFWKAAVELFCFDAVFAIAIYLVYSGENQAFRYIAGWAFTTMFFSALAVYIVRLYGQGPRRT